MSKSHKEDFVFGGFEPANTTPVPDVLFDELLAELTGTELKILLYIIRRTWGFKKDADAISLNQFQKGITTKDGKVLDRGSGVSDRKTVLTTLSSLETKGCIQIVKSKTASGDNATSIYRINFKGVVGKTNHPSQEVVGKTNHGGGKNQPRVVVNSNPQETVIQETVIQEKESTSATPVPPIEPSIPSSTPLDPNHIATATTPPKVETDSGLSPDEQRVQSYWCEFGFEERPSAKKHWATLARHIKTFEQFKSLFEYTENEILKDTGFDNKTVNPGNLANAQHLDGWKQKQRRTERAKKEAAPLNRPKTLQEMDGLEKAKYWEQKYSKKPTTVITEERKQS